MNKLIVVLSIVFGVAVLAIGLTAYYYVAPTIKQTVDTFHSDIDVRFKQNTEKYEQTFLKDHAEIKALGLLPIDFNRDAEVQGIKSDKDAAFFLNTKLPLLGQKISVDNFLFLPESLMNRLVINPNSWSTGDLYEKGEVVPVFKWMQKLNSFTYWSEENAGFIEKSLKENPFENFFEAKVEFNYILFLNWAKLRWNQSFYGEAESPQSELRHLAGLLYSRGTLSSFLMAVKILALEIKVDNLFPKLLEKKAVSQSNINQMVRYFYAASGLLRTAMFVPSHHELYNKIELGKCIAVEGAMPYFLMLYKPIFTRAWKEYYFKIGKSIHTEKCSRKRFQFVWDNSQFVKKYMKEKSLMEQVKRHFFIDEQRALQTSHSEEDPFMHLPKGFQGTDIYELRKYKLLARIFSTSLLAMSSPDPWQYYSNQK